MKILKKTLPPKWNSRWEELLEALREICGELYSYSSPVVCYYSRRGGFGHQFRFWKADGRIFFEVPDAEGVNRDIQSLLSKLSAWLRRHEDGERRSHKIEEDAVVQSSSQTCDACHGGQSQANEVENGDARPEGQRSEGVEDSSAGQPSHSSGSGSGEEPTEAGHSPSCESTPHEGSEPSESEAGLGGAPERGTDSTSRSADAGFEDRREGQKGPNGAETSPSSVWESPETGGSGEFIDFIPEDDDEKTYEHGEREEGERAGQEAGRPSAGEAGSAHSQQVAPAESSNPSEENNTSSLVEEVLNMEVEPARTPRRDFNLPYLTEPTPLEKWAGKVNKKKFRALKKIFKRAVDFVSNGRATPRIDPKKALLNMLKGRSPHTAFKTDMENGRLLLMVDVSGSMSGFDDLVPYFVELAKLWRDEVILIINENAVPTTTVVDGVEATAKFGSWWDEGRWEKTHLFYDELIRKYNIKLIVAFTDWDGVSIYKKLLEKTPAQMVALDTYCCATYDEPIKPRPERVKKYLPEELWEVEDKISYWYAVGDWDGVIAVLNEEL